MRLIYVDEAGTGPSEPVRVVASVIVHGDDQLRQIHKEMERIFDERVPTHLREGFIFHGLEVFNGGKKIKREEWSFEDRLDFFKEFICLPFVFDVPIGLGVMFKDTIPSTKESDDLLAENKINAAFFEHAIAFGLCLERSDHFLRHHLCGKEVGSVVAEDIGKNKKLLATAAMTFKSHPVILRPQDQSPSNKELILGITPTEKIVKITNIVDVPHFVQKSGAPLLQLADACAFAFRRFLSKQPHGTDLCLAMLGEEQGHSFIDDPVWFNGMSQGLFNTMKYWDEDRKRQYSDNKFLTSLRMLINRAPQC